jgi:hypothetical protein
MKASPRSAAHRGRDGLSLLQQRLSSSRNLFMEKELRRATTYQVQNIALEFFLGEGNCISSCIWDPRSNPQNWSCMY